MRSKHRRWLFVWASWVVFLLHCEPTEADNALNSTRAENSTSTKSQRSVFSPRMDYDQWTPLGRGDPLKNDPTYDYVPPVLEHVHYWMEPSHRKPDPPLPGEQNQKTEILVLGVSSKKPSLPLDSRREMYDPFMKFVDGPKFQSNYQRKTRPHYQVPYSYFPSPFYKSKISEHFSFVKNENVPYTILVPPPVPSETDQTTTPSTVTVQEANLVYMSSTLDDKWKDEPSNLVTWRTPFPNKEYKIAKNATEGDELSFAMTLNSDGVQISSPDIMYKGQVSDGDMDVASKYVNIGKPEAQLHSSSALGMEGPIVVQPMPFFMKPMQTMQPPSVSSKSTFATTMPELNTMSSFIANIPKATTRVYTTTPRPSTTSINSLTTDPLFKHYKQPSEPLRGPMYLIIQGHSKVKTYGPTKQVHTVNLQEYNEISNSDYKDEFRVKHLHTYKKKPEESSRTGRSSNLRTLSQVIQTGFGAIDYANSRQDVQETELEAGFEVAHNVSDEVYRKGVVEEENL